MQNLYLCLLSTTALLVATLGHTAETSEALEPVEPLKISRNITLAGLLTDDLIPSLKAQHALVIDLRTAEEGAADEAKLLAKSGIDYFNLPIDRSPLQRSTVAEFTRLLASNSHRPVLVHCSSGNRAGLLWAAHLIDQGVGATDALQEVEPIVTKAPARQAIVDYAAKQPGK